MIGAGTGAEDTCALWMLVSTVVRGIFFVATIALAIVVVVATKGSLERLGQLRFRMLWLLFVGLAIQIALEVTDFPTDRIEDVGFAILLVSYAAILSFCVITRWVPRMTVMA